MSFNDTIYPSSSDGNPSQQAADPAVEMIRQKIRNLYGDEPDAAAEVAEVKALTTPGSKHQQYMQGLNASGKSLVEVQTAWHSYYAALPDHEKYEVWQEFNAQNQATNLAPKQAVVAQPAAAQAGAVQTVVNGHTPTHSSQQATAQPTINGTAPTAGPVTVLPAPITSVVSTQQPQALPSLAQNRNRQAKRHANRSANAVNKAAGHVRAAINREKAADIKKRILHSVRSGGSGKPRPKLQAKHHLQSLLFGLGAGAVVVFIFLFSFFNQFIIAPLIQPSRKVNDTPVIVNVASTVVSGGPKVLIPKINVEIPVDYSQTTTDEKQIELALDKGIVHYPTTALPGQIGNAAYFGHSSNNIFNPGKYKFAFVLLHTLVEGDTFYLSNNGQTYAYKVFSKRVVAPSEVSVLLPVDGHTATATLITCDPPGTSINRLIVVGDQISPDPSANGTSTATATNSGEAATAPADTETASKTALPGNGPSLWSRIWSTIF